MQQMQETQVRSLGQEDSPEGGSGDPLQFSCLENPMDRGAWWATVHGAASSQTRPSTHTWRGISAASMCQSQSLSSSHLLPSPLGTQRVLSAVYILIPVSLWRPAFPWWQQPTSAHTAPPTYSPLRLPPQTPPQCRVSLPLRSWLLHLAASLHCPLKKYPQEARSRQISVTWVRRLSCCRGFVWLF